ncbi:hypothetical protein BV25DRAFT_941847 [Artomyces pyxidatus]|uniref:Uncharacterized protein n=1 Tax=Artomyces pyxidatus TaxID=48021 RepID=A0ACB8SWI0_9AGAM|nr:hypothetical protein BV25DRAFT_941847 [Artomyces pyxidatus]
MLTSESRPDTCPVRSELATSTINEESWEPIAISKASDRTLRSHQGMGDEFLSSLVRRPLILPQLSAAMEKPERTLELYRTPSRNLRPVSGYTLTHRLGPIVRINICREVSPCAASASKNQAPGCCLQSPASDRPSARLRHRSGDFPIHSNCAR